MLGPPKLIKIRFGEPHGSRRYEQQFCIFSRDAMEQLLHKAFASQRSVPNKKLADMIARVEKKYGIDSAELDDEALGWVSAAGEQNHPLSKKEDEDE